MLDSIVDAAQDALSSPWGYLALFAFAAIDAFFPVVPSESLVVTAGVFSASEGEPSLPLVILAASTGAFLGDNISYFFGRKVGVKLVDRATGKRKAGFDWATAQLRERGGVVLIIARYIPGGRTAVTLTMGATGYPWRRFLLFDALAALSWGVYSAMIGYLGGHAFEDDPIKGLALGFALAMGVAGIVEVVRHVRKKRALKRAPQSADEPDAERV